MGVLDFFRRKGEQYGDAGNAIVSVIEDTCEHKWTVLITTALPALGRAFIMLIEVQPDEVLEEYLEPKGRRKRKRRKRTRGTRGRPGLARGIRPYARPRLPYIDGWLADKLPGRGFFEGRKAGSAEKWFWKAINVSDRLLWYWLLLDVADNFVINWHSNIMESRFCDQTHEVLWSCTDDQRRSNPTRWWEIGSVNIVKAVNTGLGGDGIFSVTPAGQTMKGVGVATATIEHDDFDGNRPNRTEIFGTALLNIPFEDNELFIFQSIFVSGTGFTEYAMEFPVHDSQNVRLEIREDDSVDGQNTGPATFRLHAECDFLGEYD